MVVMANLEEVPLLGVRNMYEVVPLPKSKIRDQLGNALGFTQVATEYPVKPPTTVAGRAAYWLVPLSVSALPWRPALKVAPPDSVAVLPLPEESAAVVPLDSSNL
jgi:hypothetical protein